MKPLDTLAREMVMKIAKRSKFEGREPVDQYLSWTLNPYFWLDKPIIAVRYPGLKDLLGVDHSVKHVSYNSLITADGQYRLGAPGRGGPPHARPRPHQDPAQAHLLRRALPAAEHDLPGLQPETVSRCPATRTTPGWTFEEVTPKLTPEQQARPTGRPTPR